MKLIPVENIPKRMVKNNLTALFEEFLNMEVDCVEISGIADKYSNLNSAQSTLCYAAKKYGYPVMVCKREGKLYFKKIK